MKWVLSLRVWVRARAPLYGVRGFFPARISFAS
jgi:hypothetical protein